MFRACVSTHFSASFRIADHPRYSQIHGHTFVVDVCVSSDELDSYGMVMDFEELDKLVREVVEKLDKKNLNEALGLSNVTAEVIAKFIAEEVGKKLDPRLRLDLVRVRVSPKSWAEYVPQR